MNKNSKIFLIKKEINENGNIMMDIGLKENMIKMII